MTCALLPAVLLLLAPSLIRAGYALHLVELTQRRLTSELHHLHGIAAAGLDQDHGPQNPHDPQGRGRAHGIGERESWPPAA